MPGDRPSHVGDVPIEIGMADELDRSDAGLALERLFPGKHCHPGTKIGVILKISRDQPRVVTAEAGEPVLYIGGVADLGCFAVADDVQPDFDLTANCIIYAFCRSAIELAPIVGFALFPSEEQ